MITTHRFLEHTAKTILDTENNASSIINRVIFIMDPLNVKRRMTLMTIIHKDKAPNIFLRPLFNAAPPVICIFVGGNNAAGYPGAGPGFHCRLLPPHDPLYLLIPYFYFVIPVKISKANVVKKLTDHSSRVFRQINRLIHPDTPLHLNHLLIMCCCEILLLSKSGPFKG